MIKQSTQSQDGYHLSNAPISCCRIFDIFFLVTANVLLIMSENGVISRAIESKVLGSRTALSFVVFPIIPFTGLERWSFRVLLKVMIWSPCWFPSVMTRKCLKICSYYSINSFVRQGFKKIAQLICQQIYMQPVNNTPPELSKKKTHR